MQATPRNCAAGNLVKHSAQASTRQQAGPAEKESGSKSSAYSFLGKKTPGARKRTPRAYRGELACLKDTGALARPVHSNLHEGRLCRPELWRQAQSRPTEPIKLEGSTQYTHIAHTCRLSAPTKRRKPNERVRSRREVSWRMTPPISQKKSSVGRVGKALLIFTPNGLGIQRAAAATAAAAAASRRGSAQLGHSIRAVLETLALMPLQAWPARQPRGSWCR